MKKTIYLVCTTAGSPQGERPCAVFSNEEDALKECRRLAEKAKKRTEEIWSRVFGSRKRTRLIDFRVGRTRKPRGCRGYGVRRDEKSRRSSIVHDLVFFVDEYDLDKRSMRLWA